VFFSEHSVHTLVRAIRLQYSLLQLAGRNTSQWIIRKCSVTNMLIYYIMLLSWAIMGLRI